jgi:hypothetical protein
MEGAALTRPLFQPFGRNVGREGTALNHPLLHQIGRNEGRKWTASNHCSITVNLETEKWKGLL